jgi:hypothetical protein
MNLKAKVKQITGATKHFHGKIEDGKLIGGSEFPPPDYIEIEEANEGFYLLYFDSVGNCMTDTWHKTLDDAKEQARVEFEIQEEDWIRPTH